MRHAGSSPRPWGTRPPARRAALPRLVHPHARGEHLCDCSRAVCVCGSSPRPWGTRARPGHPGDLLRFIPTPVGNTSRASTSSPMAAVHPHARGEHAVACRGSMVPAVHPHARGEHTLRAGATKFVRGSSPRPWGTLDQLRGVGLGHRFIPTPVGNTLRGASRLPGASVHPHARGEHAVVCRLYAIISGSSPRPWGTHGPGSSANCKPSVHPHARGEHGIGSNASQSKDGSSPRPWGTPVRPRPPPQRHRFIPTPVGNTPDDALAGPGSAVHPHARGEHSRMW